MKIEESFFFPSDLSVEVIIRDDFDQFWEVIGIPLSREEAQDCITTLY